MRNLFVKITFILVLLLLIGGFNVDAFGREYTTTGKIAIGQGKGTVVVEIWTAKIGSDSKDDWKETTGAQVTVSGKANDGLLSLQYRYFRFWAKSADEGYTFDAWYTNAECTENRTPNSGSDYYQTSNSCYGPTYEYYAKFIPNPYTITLDNQSATTAGTASIAVTFDANTNLTSAITKPTRTGYTFKGYYTGKNGSGVQIINQNGNVVASAAGGGKTYTDASRNWKYAGNITLYAHWTANTYVVSFNSHGGTTKGNTTVTYDATYGASTNWPTDPTLTGYTFAGWWTAATSGEQVTASTVVKITSAQTLHAHWTANTYTIAYNANGGTGTTSSSSHTYDVAKALTTNGYSKTGYSFVGWATSKALADAGTKAYDDGQSVTNLSATQGATVTLYAIWTVNSYTVTLNNQSATTAGTPSIAVTFDANTNLTTAITKPTKTGCTFEGYYTAVNGGGVQIINRDGNVIASVSGYTDASKNWKYANNLELFAYWKQNQTIQWTLSDGAGVEYTTGQEMGAVAYGDFSLVPSGLEIAYSTEPSSVATIVDGKLNVLIPNATVTVCANQGGSHDYNAAAVTVCKTFTTAGCTPDGHSVTAANITYGQTLASSTLSGTVTAGGVAVAGTLSWVEPTTAPNAGASQPFEVLFTPTNTSVYGSITFNVPVNVAKADPVITWNITNNLRENTIYSHFVTSTNTENALTVGETSDDLSVSGLVLTTVEEIGDEEKSGIVLTAHQDESANYNEITDTKTVTIYPKVAQCLPVSVNSEDVMTNMGSRFDGTGSWCGTANPGSASFIVSVSYTQSVGIQLGNWNEGFSGIKNIGDFVELVKNWNLVPSGKSIELAFTGVPDSLTISTAMQTVSYDLFGWHDAPNGEPTPTWTIYQRSLDGAYSSVTTFTGSVTDHKVALNPEARYVKISLNSAFAGFVTKLHISRKNYIHADQASMVFGTETHPLQEPQTLTLSYSSLGDCEGTNDYISVTSSNPAFYVDETTITENVGIEQSGEYVVRVRCNDVHQSGTLTFTSNDGTSLEIPVSSEKPAITTSATAIFQTGTEHNPVSGTAYRAQRTLFTSDILEGLFNGSTPIFDTLYIYGVSESAAASREWVYSPAKGYNVPVVTASNVHTPCFVYKKEGAQYTYVRTFDASTKTLNVTDSKTRVFVGYRPKAPATTALQLESGAAVSLNNTEIVATNAAIAVSGNATIAARGANIVSSASKAAIQLAGTATLTINDSWKTDEPSAILALRPASGYPSIDLGSASGRVDIYGTQLELHNAANMAIAHMSGTTEKFDGEVYINDGSVGGETTLGMPKLTFIDGGTFNDGDVVAYTLKGQPKRPRNSRGEIVSRHTMSPAALASGYSWYGQTHLTLDGSAKVNPMLMDEEVWIFNGDAGEGYNNGGSWNKGSVPGETDDVLINAPMVISGGELKVKSLTINWEDKGKGIPAVTVNPNGGLTVGEGGIDAIKLANPAENLVLRADQELSSATKGQTGFLRIHPESAEPMPKATVELYSTTWYNKANEAGNTTRFQCVGTPIADEGVVASTVFPTGTLLYAWNENTEKWTNSRTKELVPFKGYDLSQKLSNDGLLVTFTGTLASGDKTIDLAHTSSEKGFNLLANSYTAPISIEEFIDDDFVNASQTIYILNAGTKAESNAQAGGLDAAGKWVGIPAKTASELAAEGYPCVIPSMQGFWVQSTGAGAQLKLNYDRLVMEVTYTEPTANKPLRVAKSRETEQVGKLMINLYTETDADCVFILESDSYDAAYEDGYDARKIASETMDVFTIRDSEQLGVDATNTIEGTRVGVRTGEETTYTFRFSHLQSNKDLVLWDKETKMKVFIDEDIEYTFYAVPNSEITERFQIVAANIPTITTGVDEIESETKVQKFIKDNQLYILKDGVLYNATGAVVRK